MTDGRMLRGAGEDTQKLAETRYSWARSDRQHVRPDTVDYMSYPAAREDGLEQDAPKYDAKRDDTAVIVTAAEPKEVFLSFHIVAAVIRQRRRNRRLTKHQGRPRLHNTAAQPMG